MAEKRKRRILPRASDPGSKSGEGEVPDREELIVKEDFGENTFAGALEAVKGVLEQASANAAKVKARKKG
jgi:hypothetical protein